MGIYKYYQKYNNYPSYYGPGGRRLYFLIGSGWLIGPTLGNPTGYIHNRGASINDNCTEERSHPYHKWTYSNIKVSRLGSYRRISATRITYNNPGIIDLFIVDLCFVFSWLRKACRVVSSGIAASPSVIICLEFQPFSRRTLDFKPYKLWIEQSAQLFVGFRAYLSDSNNQDRPLKLPCGNAFWCSVL